MKAIIKDLFSISTSDTEYFNDEQDKFELISCPINEKYCKKLRPAINKDYQMSQLYRRDKIYQESINSLKCAYDSTFQLKEASCANCANFFRNSIIESMENIKNEQRRRSAGLFNIKLPELNFIKLDNVLKDI